MKKLAALFFIMSMNACVDEIDTSTTEEAIVAPDAGMPDDDLSQRKNIEAFGRKGGETGHCTSNCD